MRGTGAPRLPAALAVVRAYLVTGVGQVTDPRVGVVVRARFGIAPLLRPARTVALDQAAYLAVQFVVGTGTVPVAVAHDHTSCRSRLSFCYPRARPGQTWERADAVPQVTQGEWLGELERGAEPAPSDQREVPAPPTASGDPPRHAGG